MNLSRFCPLLLAALPGCIVPANEYFAMEARAVQAESNARSASQREAQTRAALEQSRHAALQAQIHAGNVLTDERLADLRSRLGIATTQLTNLQVSGTATRQVVDSLQAYITDLQKRLAAHDQALVALGRVQQDVEQLQHDVGELKSTASMEAQHRARVLHTWQQRTAQMGGVQ